MVLQEVTEMGFEPWNKIFYMDVAVSGRMSCRQWVKAETHFLHKVTKRTKRKNIRFEQELTETTERELTAEDAEYAEKGKKLNHGFHG